MTSTIFSTSDSKFDPKFPITIIVFGGNLKKRKLKHLCQISLNLQSVTSHYYLYFVLFVSILHDKLAEKWGQLLCLRLHIFIFGFSSLFPIIRSISIPCLPFCKIGPNFFQTVVTMMPDFKSGLSTEYKRKYRIGELGNSGGHQIFPRKCIFAHFIIWTFFLFVISYTKAIFRM